MKKYFCSRRRVSEPETPAPRFHWRTRVDNLMSEEDGKAKASNLKCESSPMPINSTKEDKKNNEIRGIHGGTGRRSSHGSSYKDEITTPRSRFGLDTQPINANIEEMRRERFVRTNSDSRLKMRVRFSKEELSETSRSLDGADENNDLPNNHWRTRHLRRSRSKEKSVTSSLDRSEGNISEDDGNQDDDCLGACGVSFDSGLDLRGSLSQEEDDERFMDDTVNGRARLSEKEHVQEPALSDTRSTYDSLSQQSSSALPTSSCHDGGAIPKKSCSITLGKCAQKNNGIEFNGSQDFHTEGALDKMLDDKNKHFDNFQKTSSVVKMEIEKDYFRDPSPDTHLANQPEHQVFDNIFSQRETTQPDQIPGFGFFSDQIDGIEEIIEKIISEEEAEGNNEGIRLGDIPPMMMNDADLQREITDLQSNIDACNYESSFFYEDGVNEEMEKEKKKQLDALHKRYLRCRDISRQTSTNMDDKGLDGETEDDAWSCVPKILLEDIFTLLTPKDRHQSSQVCRQWYDLFYSPRVWETFILLERTLTKKRFNLYKGYQRELCPWKTQVCLKRVGSFFKRIVITPISDYFNLCEFLRILAAFLQYQEEHGQNAMPLLHTFDFTFACATRGEEGVMVHGTGGQILDMIVKLIIQMSGLKHLKLNQLLTDVDEVPGLLSALANCFCESLNSLEMLNVTKVPFSLSSLAQFRNLIKLTISPQHLDEEILILLAGLNLLHLHLVQDVYTCQCEPVSREAWKLLKEMAPWMRVYLEVSGITRSHLVIQPRAPVHGVLLRTPFSQLSNDLLTELVEHYSKTLRYLVQEHLPRIHGPRNFHRRCDSSLLFLVRRCPQLHTLVVSERISTATLILIASEGKNLNTLLVRQNALIKRCDWSSNGELSQDFYQRLKTCALDYEKCTNEVSTILRHRWRPLTDKQFMRLKIVPKVNIF